MKDNTGWTNTPSSKGKVQIPNGYHDGTGYVDTTSVYNVGVNDGRSAIRVKILYEEQYTALGYVPSENYLLHTWTNDTNKKALALFVANGYGDTALYYVGSSFPSNFKTLVTSGQFSQFIPQDTIQSLPLNPGETAYFIQWGYRSAGAMTIVTWE